MWSTSSRRNDCPRSSWRAWRPSRWKATCWPPERRRSTTSRLSLDAQSIVAAHRELLNSARREICVFDKPPYAQARPHITEEALSIEPEWQALERNVTLRVVYHPGFDPDRLAELGLFANKGEQSRTSPVPMKLILVDSHIALIPSMRSYSPGHELRASIVRHALLVEALAVALRGRVGRRRADHDLC